MRRVRSHITIVLKMLLTSYLAKWVRTADYNTLQNSGMFIQTTFNFIRVYVVSKKEFKNKKYS